MEREHGRVTRESCRSPSGRAGRLAVAAAGTVVGAVLALTGCAVSGPGNTGSTPTNNAPGYQAAVNNPDLDSGTPLHGKPAPEFRLRNQFGQPMSLSQFRGKVILLSFDDSRCTTVCPLTTTVMLEAKAMLGAAGDQVQLLGVDANPKATAVSDVMAFSRAHGMVNRWDFLTGTKAQLHAVWKSYGIYAQISHGLVDHTPALFVISSTLRQERLYLVQMAYAGTTQQAQIVAEEASRLLPGHPKLDHAGSLGYIRGFPPGQTVRLPRAGPAGGQVTLAADKPHLVLFFATWLSEVSNLRARLTGLNSYAKVAAREHLPTLTAVDEAVTEPASNSASRYIARLGRPLNYPVALDTSGRLADGYGVQDQPWYVLTSANGKILWHHDGWLTVAALETATRKALGGQ